MSLSISVAAAEPTQQFAPVIVAAAIAGAVAIATTFTNLVLGRHLHQERLRLDERLVELRAVKEAEAIELKADKEAAFAAWARRADLAEECLALFYEVQAVMNYARLPVKFWKESEDKRPIPEGESAEASERREGYYVNFLRLQSRRKCIEKLYALRYRAAATFGKPAEKPFMDMHDVWNDMESALETLFTVHPSAELYVQTAEKKIWNTTPDDEIRIRMENIVSAAESYLRAPFDNTHRKPTESDTILRPKGPHGWEYLAP